MYKCIYRHILVRVGEFAVCQPPRASYLLGGLDLDHGSCARLVDHVSDRLHALHLEDLVALGRVLLDAPKEPLQLKTMDTGALANLMRCN